MQIDIINIVEIGLISLISFILKSIYNDLKSTKNLALKNENEINLIKKDVELNKENIKSHHGKIGGLYMLSNEIKIVLGRLDERLKTLDKNLKDD